MKKFDLSEAIEKGRIIFFADAPKLVSKELEASEEDLFEAKKTLDSGNLKWATIQAYYSMFHAARALLYVKKYREKSHIHLAFAIRSLYIEKGILPTEFYDDFIQGMDLRQMADYKRKFSESGAKRNIQAAVKILALVKKILKR